MTILASLKLNDGKLVKYGKYYTVGKINHYCYICKAERSMAVLQKERLTMVCESCPSYVIENKCTLTDWENIKTWK